MKILVFADSHGDTGSVAQVMKRYYPDVAIHLGDGTDDLSVLGKGFPSTQFFYVTGNSNEPDNQGEPDRLITLEGVSIFLTHMDRFRFKKDIDTVSKAMELNAQIILCGDSHTPELFFSSGITFMNPGSISKEFGFRTFGIIAVIDGEYSCEVLFADLFLA